MLQWFSARRGLRLEADNWERAGCGEGEEEESGDGAACAAERAAGQDEDENDEEVEVVVRMEGDVLLAAGETAGELNMEVDVVHVS